VKVIPHPPGRLNEDTRAPVGLVNQSFNARRFSKQRLFVHDARVRIYRGALLSVRGRGDCNEPSDRNRAKDETCSRQ
jgi:hypothetical protein